MHRTSPHHKELSSSKRPQHEAEKPEGGGKRNPALTVPCTRWVRELATWAGFMPRKEIVVDEVRGHRGREEQEGLLGHIKELGFDSK